MKIKSYNIVLYPQASIRSRAISFAKTFRNHEPLFMLSREKYIPHVSIYMFDMPVKNVRSVNQKLSALAKTFQPVALTSGKYRNTSAGYFDVSYKKEKALSKIQKEIVEVVNPFRESVLREKDVERLKSPLLSKEQKENIKKFGYMGIGKCFDPHLTLARLSADDKKLLKKLSLKDFSFFGSTIALCERGEHGTCKKILATYKLTGR